MRYVFGADFGGTRTKLGLVEITQGKVLASSVIPTEKADEHSLVVSLCREFDRLTESCGVSREIVEGIGISIGSYIFQDSGVADTMCGFIGIPDQYPMRQRMEEQFGIACRVENDARLIGYAESLYGAGRGYGRVLMLTMGTGVGVGFTVNQRFPDPDACIHLAGHIKVRSWGEVPCLDEKDCYCAVEGCLESTCSGTALERMAQAAFGSEMDNQRLFLRADSGDARARKIIQTYLDYLIGALNQYVYVFAPDIFVLGGGVANGLEPYLETISQGIKARIHSAYCPQVALAQLREEGGILGAASLFFD